MSISVSTSLLDNLKLCFVWIIWLLPRNCKTAESTMRTLIQLEGVVELSQNEERVIKMNNILGFEFKN